LNDLIRNFLSGIAGGLEMNLIQRILATALYICVFALLLVVGSGNKCSTTGSYNPNSPGGGGDREIREVCCDQARPDGFVKFNDKNVLGNERCRATSAGQRNMCMYVRYDNLGVGEQLEVCTGFVPNDWEEVAGSKKHDGSKCGGATDPNALNVVTIKRVR
jgi:hypothetical protein